MEISRQTALEIFSLKDNFTTDELNKRYRELSKIVHPDTGGDEALFKLLTCCKNTLTGTASKASSTKSSSPASKSNEKANAYVNLKTLEEIYFSLSEYLSEWNIIEIRSMARIQISPRWKKEQSVSMNINLAQPFEQFQRAGFVSFSKTISIPETLKKYKAFNVRVEFMGETHRFKISTKKPVHTIKHKHYLKFNSLLELKFE